MRAGHLVLGEKAEIAAAEFLQRQALRIELRNYRCRTGELDIVARDADGTLVIAEVRLRSSTAYGDGAASITPRKQRRLLRASRHLLATHRHYARCAVRFDVLDVRPLADGFDIHWIRHAFTC
jgi:putative endonuclease